MTMADWQFTKGLHDLGNGAYAYLQPDGSWGWSNAGLVVDGDQSLLVDTLFDQPLTRQMLDVMADASGAAKRIDTVVNTHANADHTFGNGLVKDAEIIASEASASEWDGFPPEALAEMMRNTDQMGDVGAFFAERFSAFDFENCELVGPSRTFSGRLDVKVGDKSIELIEVGPAHTLGDILIHVPDNKVLYTGDILFIGGTPIIWAGPVGNWIKACELIMDLDVDVIVPGHGPIADKADVRRMQEYLKYIDTETRKRYDAGLSMEDAIGDIALGDYSSWGEAERIAVNVSTLYREYAGDTSERDIMSLFAMMAKIAH
jgi:glyoxylase-like metal-dependent hydrolase (beta-lactamase superfamily II)